MTNKAAFTIFNPATGKVVGDTNDISKVDYINSNYMGIMIALPFDEFISHCEQLRNDGNKSPYL
jgi:hypothetical protein